MAQPSQDYFATITTLSQHTLTQITFQRLDVTPQRAIWELHGTFQDYDIRLKEVFIQAGRMYSYYILLEEKVVVGFDNYADRQALQMQYGTDFKAHLEELIPHKHGANKASLELTSAMTVEQFLYFLTTELQSHSNKG